jgi:hypothetical protein
MTITYRGVGTEGLWPYGMEPTYPTGYQAGDVLIFVATVTDNLAIGFDSGSEGWTNFIDHQANATLKMMAWWKVATGSEAVPHITSGVHDNGGLCYILAFTPTIAVSPPIGMAGAATDVPSPGSTVSEYASVNTAAGDMVVGLYASTGSTTSRIVTATFPGAHGGPITTKITQFVAYNGLQSTSQAVWGTATSAGTTGTFHFDLYSVVVSQTTTAFTITESSTPSALVDMKLAGVSMYGIKLRREG